MRYNDQEIFIYPEFKVCAGLDLEVFVEWLNSELWRIGQLAFRDTSGSFSCDIGAAIATGSDPTFPVIWRGRLRFRSIGELCVDLSGSPRSIAKVMLDRGFFGSSDQAEKIKQSLKEVIEIA